jgi:hypothetical protein
MMVGMNDRAQQRKPLAAISRSVFGIPERVVPRSLMALRRTFCAGARSGLQSLGA